MTTPSAYLYLCIVEFSVGTLSSFWCGMNVKHAAVLPSQVCATWASRPLPSGWVEPWKDLSLYGKRLTEVFVIMNIDLGA